MPLLEFISEIKTQDSVEIFGFGGFVQFGLGFFGRGAVGGRFFGFGLLLFWLVFNFLCL